MGSHNSLWVTNPYDLEIGSSRTTFSTQYSTGAAKGARGSDKARSATAAEAVQCTPPCERANVEETISRFICRCMPLFCMHGYAFVCHGKTLLCAPQPAHKHLRYPKLDCVSSRRGCCVVKKQMGSHNSLWVTDPYNLEIGSSKTTRISCPRSKHEGRVLPTGRPQRSAGRHPGRDLAYATKQYG